MTTPKTASPEWAASQASPWATVNEAIRRVEAGAGMYRVEDNDLSSPPGSCVDGAQYIVGIGSSGAWAGHDNDIAVASGANASNGWYFIDTADGDFAWVKDEDALFYYAGNSSPGTWTAFSLGGVTTLDGLSDVDVPAPADGQVLTYDTSSPQGWKALPLPFEHEVAVSDETTALTTGTAKVTFRMPCAVNLTAVRASLSIAQSSGGQVIVDINEGGSTILSTKILIDNGSRTSVGSSPQPTISDSALADDAEMTVDIDNIGDGTAKGLKITLIGARA